jgi:DNA-binding transcriptional MocR family regulator
MQARASSTSRNVGGAGGVGAIAIAAATVALSWFLMTDDSASASGTKPGTAGDRLHAELQRLVGTELRPGDRLPSTRTLVQRHRVSPLTVQQALNRLVQEGLVFTRPGHGAFVAEPRPRSTHLDHRWQAVVLGPSAPVLDEFHDVLAPPPGCEFPLGSGYLDAEAQPVGALAGAMARAARRPGAWNRLPPEGIEALRAWFARQLGDTSPDDVLIVPGGQAALSTVFRSLAAPGASVLVESPAHLGTLAALRAQALRAVPVPTDADGVRPDLLEAAFRMSGARVFACQPTYANPTGATLTAERRRAVLEVARRAGAFLVEDDAARDLAIDGATPPPLAADDDDHVVYVRSLTKPAAPGLRVAAVRARGPVRVRLRSEAVVGDLFVAGPMQEAALELVGSPAWSRHLRALRGLLRTRRDAAVAAVREHLPDVRLEVVPKGGFVLWLQLPDGVDEVAFARACAARSVQVNPGRAWFPAEPERGFVRLSYAAVSADALRLGITRMGEVLRATRPSPVVAIPRRRSCPPPSRPRTRGRSPCPPRST